MDLLLDLPNTFPDLLQPLHHYLRLKLNRRPSLTPYRIYRQLPNRLQPPLLRGSPPGRTNHLGKLLILQTHNLRGVQTPTDDRQSRRLRLLVVPIHLRKIPRQQMIPNPPPIPCSTLLNRRFKDNKFRKSCMGLPETHKISTSPVRPNPPHSPHPGCHSCPSVIQSLPVLTGRHPRNQNHQMPTPD